MFCSVIIPVYNDCERIGLCLDGLLKQTYTRHQFEIITVDNGSTDKTLSVIQQYRDKYPVLIRCAVQDQIQGSYATRNKGIEEAKGEILAFTDSDCIPDPYWLEMGVKAVKKEDVSCGAGHIDFFFNGNSPNIYEYFDASRKLNQKAYVEHDGFGATANFFAKRRLFSEYGLFRNDLISGGDYEFGKRLTQSGEHLIYIPEAIVRHPARSKFRQLRKKSKRICDGQIKLERLGLYPKVRLSWRQWLPKISYLKVKDLSFIQKIHLLIIANYFKYINLLRRTI
jgi:glycosyltransferase involved in cell wall biosynthesis